MIDYTSEEGAIKELLTHYSLSTITAWWCEMNCYRWPSNFPMAPPPTGHLGVHERLPELHNGLAHVMYAMIDLVGMEECLKTWNDPAQRTARAFGTYGKDGLKHLE